MARKNNLILILGIILLISPFAYTFISKGDTPFGNSYSVECSVKAENPLIGSPRIKDVTCQKTQETFCGSPFSIISGEFKLKLRAGTSTKTESFTLSELGTDKTIIISVCSKEDVDKVTLELIKDNVLKDIEEVNV